MSRLLRAVVGLGCVSMLLAACYGSALFRGEQFSFRDAGHFYYPLYLRVQQEWDAGRIPLWSPEENAGMPLLGNPTAAVLYPGKVIYALFPYAWGARLYTVSHTLLAVLAAYLLARSWAISRTGSGIAALSYGFGAPVLFQYCNIIFLVGAAWTPLGLLAVDRWLRLGRRWAIAELAVVLAMQTLGGEPQSAYLVGLCAGGYAVGLSWKGPRWLRGGAVAVVAAVGVITWIALTLAGAEVFPRLRPKTMPPSPLPWMPYVRMAIAATWVAVAAWIVRARWRDRGDRRFPLLLGLAASGVLAGLITGAQLLPVLEFSSLSVRAAAEGPHDAYPFSLEPMRMVEWIWPGFFSNPFVDNHSWLAALPLATRPRFWFPSLYIGGLTIALAFGGLKLRGVPAWQRWIVGIAALSLIGSFGEYASPIQVAREFPVGLRSFGVHDRHEEQPIRTDSELRDGDGSPYWAMATVLPGFGSFRYPSKLLTFTCLALSVLAGVGWDRWRASATRVPLWASLGFLALSLAGMTLASARHKPFVAWLGRGQVLNPGAFGPFDAEGAWRGLAASLQHGAAIFGLSGLVLLTARRRPKLAGVLALLLLAADLSWANSRFIFTTPQSRFETTPRVLEIIQEHERKRPANGPYRIHRVPVWSPPVWYETNSPDRVEEFTRWERDTIQPKYGLTSGVEYTLTQGTSELYDYWFFFAPFQGNIPPEKLKGFFIPPGDKVIYFPRRGFDLWNTRYFVLPRAVANDENRGIASFLQKVEHLYPPPGGFGSKEKDIAWSKEQDWQVVRNKEFMPRAWAVHQIRYWKPIRGMAREDRKFLMEEMLYQNDMLWSSQGRLVYDPREMAWVEDEPNALAAAAPGGAPDPEETIRIASYEPQRVEIEADLRRPGLVILADVFYPGWELTIDGVPSKIHRTNRLMRGAVVPSGRHRLVYTYRPFSLRLGVVLSVIGLLGIGVVGFWSRSQAAPPEARPVPAAKDREGDVALD